MFTLEQYFAGLFHAIIFWPALSIFIILAVFHPVSLTLYVFSKQITFLTLLDLRLNLTPLIWIKAFLAESTYWYIVTFIEEFLFLPSYCFFQIYLKMGQCHRIFINLFFAKLTLGPWLTCILEYTDIASTSLRYLCCWVGLKKVAPLEPKNCVSRFSQKFNFRSLSNYSTKIWEFSSFYHFKFMFQHAELKFIGTFAISA